MSNSKVTVVTIDGPAGAGKSTVAKALAKKLNFYYLDTGAMYRAITLKAMRSNTNLEDEESLVKLAESTNVDFSGNIQEGLRVLLDGEDVSEEIRTPNVTNQTFYIARTPGVRQIMVGWQRAIGSKTSVVVEGRDAGTVVFPDATYKFYLDADVEERARRRTKELKKAGKNVYDQEIAKKIEERDRSDMTRTVGPLKKADDAIAIDSTGLTVDRVVEEIFNQINSHE